MQVITGTASRLAIDGGKPAVSGPLKRFNTIGDTEARAAFNAVLNRPLSGYLGGVRSGGWHVEHLEGAWAEKFGVKHAVACNSATSGILIACMAVGVKYQNIYTTPYTMSGTVAPAKLLGGNLIFGDIDPLTYCLQPIMFEDHVVITTNLFGHPSEKHRGVVIEDAAQSILATRDGKRCNADITVFSGNVHKQIQCGEGGMCCTNDDGYATAMRYARNHGELAGSPTVGLNLRLTEVQAAIWYKQLVKAEWIVSSRVVIAEALSRVAKGLGMPPFIRPGCTHSYYVWALHCRHSTEWITRALTAEGFPVTRGYVTPLYKLPAFKTDIRSPMVEIIDPNLVIYENCSYDPTPAQVKQMQDALEKVAEHANRRSRDIEQEAAVPGS